MAVLNVPAHELIMRFSVIAVCLIGGLIAAGLLRKQRQAEERTRHLNAVLSAVRNVNQLITREKDRSRLLQGACDSLTERRGYYNAWIALIDETGSLVEAVESGLGEEFSSLLEQLKDGKPPACGQKALLEGGVVVTEDPISACTGCPLSAGYHGRAGYTSRLEYNGKVFGLLSVSIPSGLYRDEEEQGLLAEVAGDIAFALHTIALEQERTRVEEALRKSEAHYSSLFEDSPISLWEEDFSRVKEYIDDLRSAGVTDIRAHFEDLEAVHRCARLVEVLDVNQASLDLYGAKSKDELFAGLETVLGGETFDRFRDELMALAEGKRHFECQKIHETLAGEKVHVNISWVIAPGHEESWSKVLVSTVNITEQVQAEESLKKYSEQLEEMVDERTRQLSDAQEALVRKEKLAVLGQLAGGVGHELRNPLGVISNAVYFLQMTLTNADETTREYLGMIDEEVSTAEKIVSDLLDFSRIKAIDKENTTVSELFSQVLEKHPAPENVEVVSETAPDLPPVFADPQHIGQVLANLVTNAYQAMPDGGALTLDAHVEDEHIIIAVKDTGCGISPENVGMLFEPLFTTRARGIGLGLAVSKNLVEANGGSLKVESEEGRGSTFTLMLPAKEVQT